MTIQVGYKYRTIPKLGGPYTVHIIHRSKLSGEKPYTGYCSELDLFIEYDENGDDTWYECGGHWYRLDLSTAEPTEIKLVGIGESDV